MLKCFIRNSKEQYRIVFIQLRLIRGPWLSILIGPRVCGNWKSSERIEVTSYRNQSNMSKIKQSTRNLVLKI